MNAETRNILTAIRNIALSFDSKAVIVLYGSRARGDAEPDSDWDILIITSVRLKPEDERNLRSRIYDLELATDYIFSIIIRSFDQWDSPHSLITPFHQSVEREGIRL